MGAKNNKEAQVQKRIGLSLGADVDWPICYEEILRRLDLTVKAGGDTITFECERVTIEPFSLRAPKRYDLVLDRLTHWYYPTREWIKKAVIVDGTYVLNNPWSVQSMEKQTSYCAMMRLGLPIPETWLIPPKEYEDKPDLEVTLQRYARLFDLGSVGEQVGYPSFLKPYDGGGWVGVNKIDDAESLEKAYETSGKFVMHLQQGVLPHDRFVRCIGVGPQIHEVLYDPSAPLHQRYQTDAPETFLDEGDAEVLHDITLTINAFFGWDFNSCESLRADGTWHPIDFANPCPDSQVTSLHRHFPWLIKAKLRWSLYCAATGRRMRQNLNWEPYYAIAAEDLDPREKLRRYGALAREHFELEAFEEFCTKHLAHLDEVAWEFFGDDRARAAVRKKVEALFPEHEHDEFTDHFWNEIQAWREADAASRA